MHRIEARYREAKTSVESWTTLLRELEDAGQTSSSLYEQYWQAYARANQQLKRVELDLFNLRHIGA